MLYSLSRADLAQLRKTSSNPEVTGAEMLSAAYRTDPAVVALILPPPLKPAPTPIAMCFVARYPQTNFGCIYNEGALFLLAAFKRELGFYCLAMPVDDDMAMVYGREIAGYPKKMANITLTRTGERVVGRVVRKGKEILRIEADLDRGPKAADLSTLQMFSPTGLDPEGRPCRTSLSFLFKFFQHPDRRRFDYVPRLVRQPNLFRPSSDVRRADARVVVTSTPYDPLGEVPVMGSPFECVYGTWDITMLPGRVVGRAWNVQRFLPHAFFKTDLVPMRLGWAPPTEEEPARGAGEPKAPATV